MDAALIGRFAHRMSEFLRPVPTAEQAALKALSTRRRQLTELIAMEPSCPPWNRADRHGTELTAMEPS